MRAARARGDDGRPRGAWRAASVGAGPRRPSPSAAAGCGAGGGSGDVHPACTQLAQPTRRPASRRRPRRERQLNTAAAARSRGHGHATAAASLCSLSALSPLLQTPHPDLQVLGHQLLRDLQVVVHQAEAGGLAAPEGSAEAVQEDCLRVRHVVHLRNLLRQLRLPNGRPWRERGDGIRGVAAGGRRSPKATKPARARLRHVRLARVQHVDDLRGGGEWKNGRRPGPPLLQPAARPPQPRMRAARVRRSRTHELLALQQHVGQELAGAHGDGHCARGRQPTRPGQNSVLEARALLSGAQPCAAGGEARKFDRVPLRSDVRSFGRPLPHQRVRRAQTRVVC